MKVEMKQEYYGVVLNTLSEILKQVHQMSYNIKMLSSGGSLPMVFDFIPPTTGLSHRDIMRNTKPLTSPVLGEVMW